ncbi:LacI family DNA-binding transcriptional regulator [Enterococcus nangangensis]|uniref:LacI family DNA-binding transcriptional regulator n=1 Tax=Enterococcus nangangensis TaxID=2559926 RepID=UPI0010F9744C|nr:LacI family DNA-binding transcriptional regulator [Enterococcus nangangensis]
MTNISDIAKMSGYSKATVSRVLNQKNYVSPQAKGKILAAIAALDYVPNDIARDLSKGQTHNIGVVLPHVEHPFFSEILKGIIQQAFSTSYRIVILPSAYDEKLELTYLEQLRSKAFDALIFTSHGVSLATLAAYQKYGPVICCENPQNAKLPAVYVERAPAYEAAFQWLKDQSKWPVAILLSRPAAMSATSQATLMAYQKIFGKLPRPALVFTEIVTPKDGYQAAAELIRRGEKVAAVFSNGDDIAVGFAKAYHKNNLPQPLLIGQDQQLSGELLQLPTIDHHLRAIGEAAFTLATTKKPTQTIAIPAAWIPQR